MQWTGIRASAEKKPSFLILISEGRRKSRKLDEKKEKRKEKEGKRKKEEKRKRKKGKELPFQLRSAASGYAAAADSDATNTAADRDFNQNCC